MSFVKWFLTKKLEEDGEFRDVWNVARQQYQREVEEWRNTEQGRIELKLSAYQAHIVERALGTYIDILHLTGEDMNLGDALKEIEEIETAISILQRLKTLQLESADLDDLTF